MSTTTWTPRNDWDDVPTAPPVTDHDPCTQWGHAPVPPTPPPPAPQPHGHGHPPARARRGGKVAAIVAAGALLVGAGWVGRDAVVDDVPSVSAAPVSSSATAPPANAPLPVGDEPVADVAEALGPSVVLIQVEGGLGSGVVYDSSGLILTNAHVVGENRDVQVRLQDGSTLPGRVLGTDTATDVAVVAVDTADLPAAPLAAEPARVGQMAVAVGSPFGLEQTVTAGVVSAVDRPVDNPQGVVVAMIQTDAPINPGNSGGALANRAGEVIGINTLIFSENGENNGIGFAIPVAKAKEVADRIAAGETVERAYLGVSGEASPDGAAGAYVAQVQPGSPAAAAGVEVGDLVVALDGESVRDIADLAARIGDLSPGESVELEVVRDGRSTVLDVTVQARSGG